MDFSTEEIEEFKNEAVELLDEAEQHLLSLEKGIEFSEVYNGIFRVFHSLKGGAGMLKLGKLQSHMHQLENHYQQCKNLGSLSTELTSYFLKGIDVARQILNGKEALFDYSIPTGTPPYQTVLQQRNPEKSDNENHPHSPHHEEHAKIFVIDDELEITIVLKEILQGIGFEVFTFTSAKEAVAQLRILKPSVVLTDFNMPEMTGHDVLKAVNQYDLDLPVIYLSGYLSKEVMIQALSNGIFGALEKPFSINQVIMMCNQAAEKHQLVRLLNNTISFIYYQYSDLDQFLLTQGSKEVREAMNSQFRTLIETKRKLKLLKKTS